MPSIEEEQLVCGEVEKMYLKQNLEEDIFFTKEHYLKFDWTADQLREFMIPRLSAKDANPGIPFNVLEKEVAVLIDEHAELVADAVKHRLQKRLLSEPGKSAMWYYDNFMRDLVALFVKNEPTKITKLERDRQRLISNTSVVDRICDEILFHQVLDFQIANWRSIPSKPGMGLDDPNLDALRQDAPKPSRQEERVSSDASHWDWSVMMWLGLIAMTALISIVGAKNHRRTLMMASIYVGFSRIFVDGYGNLIHHPEGTVMESGWLLTALLNSIMRVVLHALAHYRAFNRFASDSPMAMGDDCVELCPIGRWDDMKAAYKELGFEIDRENVKDNVQFSFCSTDFYPDVAVPQHGVKMLYSLLSKKPDALLLVAFKYELRADPRLDEYLSVLDQVGWNPQ
jgi:hypothetical protein